MNYSLSVWGPLEKLIWRDVLIIAAVLFLARLVILAMQWKLRRAAETARCSETDPTGVAAAGLARESVCFSGSLSAAPR